MSAPIPAGFGQAVLHHQVDGDPDDVLTIFGFVDDNTQTPNDIATAIWDAWTGEFDPAQLLDTGHFTGVTVVINRAGVMVEGSNRGIQDGSGIEGAVSPAVTGLLTKSTGLAGRKFRGRAFLPNVYLSEEEVDQAGLIDSTRRDDLSAKWQSFIDALPTSNIDMQILHSDGVTAPTPVLTGALEPYVATQRRRQRR